MRGMQYQRNKSVSGQDSRWQTPKRQPFKLQDFPIKMEELQDTGFTPTRQPTEKQLCQCLIMISNHLPHCKLVRVLQLLNDHCLRNEQEKQRQAQKQQARLLQLMQEDDYLSDDQHQHITEFEKKRMQQEYARKFENSDANPRFYQQREIAKLFCLKGYGYPTAREYLGDNITPNRYNNVITTIVRLSYRKLQYFILKYINPKLVTISRQQLKMIKTPLVNCKNWMSSRQADNFHRFVKLTYKIPTEQPEKEVAMELLHAIMNRLKERNVTYKHHRRGEEHAGWSEQMEQSLILQFLKGATLQEMQRELMLQHPAHRSAFEIGRLRLKIDRLLRYSVKKYNGDREKFGIIQASPISDFFTNKIVRSANAANVQKRLLTYYMDRDRTAVKVRQVFLGVQLFLEMSKQDVEQIQDSSCEVVAKQELKAEQQLLPREDAKQQHEKKEDELVKNNE